MQLGLRKACRSHTGVGERIPHPSFSPFTGRTTMAIVPATHYTFSLTQKTIENSPEIAEWEVDPLLNEVVPEMELKFHIYHATLGNETEEERLAQAHTVAHKCFDSFVVMPVLKSCFVSTAYRDTRGK